MLGSSFVVLASTRQARPLHLRGSPAMLAGLRAILDAQASRKGTQASPDDDVIEKAFVGKRGAPLFRQSASACQTPSRQAKPKRDQETQFCKIAEGGAAAAPMSARIWRMRRRRPWEYLGLQ